MAQKSKRTSRLGIVIVILILLVSSGAVGVVYNLSRFYSHMDQFNLHVTNFNGPEAQKELDNLKIYHGFFSDWYLGYLSDRFLLSDMFLYEAEVLALNGNCQKAIDSLESHRDDYRAVNIIAICKFKALYAAYHSDVVQKDNKKKADIVRMVAGEVKVDFRACVEKGPGPEENFGCSYNYDIVSNPESAKKALESKNPGSQFVLGRSPGFGKMPDKGGPSDNRAEPGRAGNSPPPRKG